jgi:hypothetical protein
LNDFHFLPIIKKVLLINRDVSRAARDTADSAPRQPPNVLEPAPFIETIDGPEVRVNGYGSYSASDQNLGDAITVRPVESQNSAISQLFDEISIKLPQDTAADNHVLMDEIAVKPASGLAPLSGHPLDDMPYVPGNSKMSAEQPLMDVITVRSVESPVTSGNTPLDDVSVKILENRAGDNTALFDYVGVKPSPGPVNIEYELMDDLITKTAIIRARQLQASLNAAVAAVPVQAHAPKVVVNAIDIAEIFKETEELKAPANKDGGNGRHPVESHNPVDGLKNILSALRIYNKSEFYIRDTVLRNVDLSAAKPRLKNYSLYIVRSPIELAEVFRNCYLRKAEIAAIERRVKNGMLVLLLFADGELASTSWACTTRESMAALRGYPYTEDLDRSACLVGDWISPKFQACGISDYMKSESRRLLIENGIALERSLVQRREVDEYASKTNGRTNVVYKRRTYTNYSLLGIIGLEFRREHRLNQTEIKPAYQMSTLSLLVLPSPPGPVAYFENI